MGTARVVDETVTLWSAGVEIYDAQWRRTYPPVGQSVEQWIIWKRPAGQWAQLVGQWAQPAGRSAPLDELTDAERRTADAGLEAAREPAEAARAGWPAPQGVSAREPLTCDDAAPPQASDLRLCVRVPQASDLRLCRNKPLTCGDAGRGGTDSSSIGPLLSVFVRGRWRLRSPDQGICSSRQHNRRSEPCGATAEVRPTAAGARGGAAIPARATAPSHGPEHSRRSGGRR